MPFPKTAQVSWVDPNPVGVVSEYRVSRNGATPVVVTQPNYNDVLNAAGTYTYDVVAANAQEVAPPASGSVVAMAVPQAVQSVTVVVVP